MSVIPTFTTSRLILRPVTEADFPSYTKHFVDYEVIRHLAHTVPWPYPDDGVAAYLASEIFPDLGKDVWFWGLCLREQPDEVIGAVELWRHGEPENRGFWLGRAHWGKGYMTEAVEPVMDYAFDELGFDKLVFANAVGNARSGRVKEKTGARLIGRHPARYVDPALTEHEIYELTKDEWAAFKGNRDAAR